MIRNGEFFFKITENGAGGRGPKHSDPAKTIAGTDFALLAVGLVIGGMILGAPDILGL
jgi:hypothetical protein